jgi:hypothetical protein
MDKIKHFLIESFAPFLKGKPGYQGTKIRETFQSDDKLVESHFSKNSEANHICRNTLEKSITLLDKSPAIIVETGSSAWGTNSSLLFDSYINSFGGSFSSVDLRSSPMFNLRSQCTNKSNFFCDDSISFLRKYVNLVTRCNLVYLDSWDVNWEDPLPSALHGFSEFLIMLPMLKKGGILLVDDTPFDINVMIK